MKVRNNPSGTNYLLHLLWIIAGLNLIIISCYFLWERSTVKRRMTNTDYILRLLPEYSQSGQRVTKQPTQEPYLSELDVLLRISDEPVEDKLPEVEQPDESILASYATEDYIPKKKASESETQNRISKPTSLMLRSFAIDYENDRFLKDGKPFQYVSGSLHYFRVPRAYWRDRLRKFGAAGLNVVSTYVEWSTHESSPGNYRFEGEQDLEHFLKLAVEEDLLVILRPGPYICAERDLGGLPSWLMNKYPNIKLRTNDSNFQNEVKKWFNVLFHKMEKHLYGNGGPIIMVQIENEYGAFDCNMEYKIWLRDLMASYVQNKSVLFTVNQPDEEIMKCGNIPGIFSTVDFGTNMSEAFSMMRKFTPKGPLVNSEFYTGWISWWGTNMSKRETNDILITMKQMLQMNASFNLYVMHGGTNFGFTNGANYETMYFPQLTSYDYDAPLDEAGDPTPKYYEIRRQISEYFPLSNVPTPKPSPKGKYGKIVLRPAFSIFDGLHILKAETHKSPKPKTFEEMDLDYGYMLYETEIKENVNASKPTNASNWANVTQSIFFPTNSTKDRANVYADGKLVVILNRNNNSSTQLRIPSNAKLSILIENQGRINYGRRMNERKGLVKTPTINGKSLISWKIIKLPFKDVSWADSFNTSTQNVTPPATYIGELTLPPNVPVLDTYVDVTGWGKGVIFLNNFNLGRYWPSAGSQVTLYVPACHLLPAPKKNVIVMFETDIAHPELQITFTGKPILDKNIQAPSLF